ncbi:GGDEF domain-containing protein [Sphingomonas sp. 4RDLI-65]|uniref:GGDEF domain-containing protein n=1 Tax=Sphingomonas sp. 4RDLI-65 TaxID=3111641 RepID=UPI003C21BDD7
MRDARATKSISGPTPRDILFDQIGSFLDKQGLSPDPAHYAFAFAVLSAPDRPLARAVAELTEDGVRLSRQDIERLGGQVVDGPPLSRPRTADQAVDETVDTAMALVVQTQQQVDGFAQMMRTMRDETRGFGRDLEKSAAAITQMAEIDEITRITTTMIGRIRDSEVRLAEATAEADALRAKLAEARESARRDMLTGLPNRRAFEEAFAERDPEAGPYCLAVCDIDRFKRVNDLHGHGVGDRVLTAIGQAMAAECAPHLVVRHGGEEFAVLLSGVGLADAAGLLDSVRATVAAKRFRNRDTDTPLGIVTFSAGITAIQGDETADAAFSRADRLLYVAKEQGRDQICAG